jgi:hypothetical protein
MKRTLALLLFIAHIGAFATPVVRTALADASHPCAMMMASQAETDTVSSPHDRADCCTPACEGGAFTCTATVVALLGSADIDLWAPPAVDSDLQSVLTGSSFLGTPTSPPPQA